MSLRRHKLVRSARVLRHVALAGVGLILAVAPWSVWGLLAAPPVSGSVVLRVDTAGLAPWPAAAVFLVSAGLLALALLQIAAMMRRVEQGAPFRAGAHLRRFALYLFLSLLASLLLPPVGQAAERLFWTPARRVTFSLSDQDMVMLLVSALLFFVARLLEEAQRVAEEHEQIV